MRQTRRGTYESADPKTTTKINSTSNNSNSAMKSFHNASLVLTMLLVLSITPCTGVPAFLNPSSGLEHDQLKKQIDDVCLSFLSEEQPLRMYDLLQDLCGVILDVLPKTEELSARETSKRLIPQLHSRRRRRVAFHDNLQALRAIHSRGQFIYRPRNGRRSTGYV